MITKSSKTIKQLLENNNDNKNVFIPTQIYIEFAVKIAQGNQ